MKAMSASDALQPGQFSPDKDPGKVRSATLHPGGTPDTFRSMAEVKQRNADAGQTWFSKENTRFFGSRVSNTLHSGPGGHFFTTSEARPAGYTDPGGPRLYSVRKVEPDGTISTHGEFQEHATAAQATRAARRAAAGPIPHSVGARVELHPGTDAWMSGDRFGTVVRTSSTHTTVKMDKSGRSLRMPHERVSQI